MGAAAALYGGVRREFVGDAVRVVVLAAAWGSSRAWYSVAWSYDGVPA